MKKILIAALIVLIVLICGFSGCTKNLDSFASCVGGKAILYVQEGCPHCADQEKLFGDSLSKLNIIDCKYNQTECSAAEIKYIPTWGINGNKSVGVKSLEELSKETGCELPK
ncbi:hypothetical protein COS75_01750 [Candidatus Pacearchaeota archaeon CG06_land_8_20_14_3_00_35_12]|nr:MAG: hypothetical protein COS75_01750 [Candidatus Pacearchaeota archaeon CG06_land_8_20_14_3_00_35_12]